MTRSHFIEATETLLVTEELGGRRYFAESPFFGREMCTDAVLDELSDYAVQIRRVNVETLVGEDITELCARQYLFRRDHDEDLTEDDEDTFPAYVRNSAEWARWKRDLPSQEPVYNPIREHGTWNHAQAGLRSAAV